MAAPETYLFDSGHWDSYAPVIAPNPTAQLFFDSPDYQFTWGIRRISPTQIAVGFLLKATTNTGQWIEDNNEFEMVCFNEDMTERYSNPGFSNTPVPDRFRFISQSEQSIGFTRWRCAFIFPVHPNTAKIYIGIGQEGSNPEYQLLQVFVPFAMNAADFNAAVAANVAAVTAPLNTQIANLNAQITALQSQGAVNLVALEQAGDILQPKRRSGTQTLKDYNVFHAVFKQSGLYQKRDLDFINIQMLSVRQAVQKMRDVSSLINPSNTVSVIHRSKLQRKSEFTAKMDNSFKEYLSECARIMEYAVDEIRNKQTFTINNPTFLREIE